MPPAIDDAVDPAMLDRLAKIAVQIGLGLKPGQDVIMTSPVSALPLARRIAATAYEMGSGLVHTLLTDEDLSLVRYRHGNDANFDRAPGWLFEALGKAYKEGTARLAILADDPMLLSAEDPDKVGRANRAQSAASRPAMEPIVNFLTNWTIVAYPGPSWAARLFPNDAPGLAVKKLADAIFSASRITGPDPVAGWAAHNAELHTRRDWLNARNFHALRYTGPGTELTIGLAEGHAWEGGAASSRNGVICNPNIPTEEVFTTPHALRTEGRVKSTKPLSHQGTLIEDIEVRFEKGAIIEAHASRGEQVLLKLIDTDEGARRLGEVALVPHSSPISKSGLLFLNTLFDENAASHIALGQCYSKCFHNSEKLSEDDVIARGGNKSLIHVDWMIGSGEIDIDGLDQSGNATPVMRKGEWA